MTISLSVLLTLVWMHFIADFIFQTDKIAINKSKDSTILLFHVLIYSIPFLWFGWIFALTNAFLHFIVDYFTSRLTSYLYKQNKRHWFFVVIGLDQAIHMTCLLVTYSFLVA